MPVPLRQSLFSQWSQGGGPGLAWGTLSTLLKAPGHSPQGTQGVLGCLWSVPRGCGLLHWSVSPTPYSRFSGTRPSLKNAGAETWTFSEASHSGHKDRNMRGGDAGAEGGGTLDARGDCIAMLTPASPGPWALVGGIPLGFPHAFCRWAWGNPRSGGVWRSQHRLPRDLGFLHPDSGLGRGNRPSLPGNGGPGGSWGRVFLTSWKVVQGATWTAGRPWPWDSDVAPHRGDLQGRGAALYSGPGARPTPRTHLLTKPRAGSVSGIWLMFF